MADFFKRNSRRLIALMVILTAYNFARLPVLSSKDRSLLASQFRFDQSTLPEVQGHPRKSVREVHPSLRHIAGWISSVGASVALNDLDGDGFSNDLCYVDTSSDQVIVAPVPTSALRYQPFTLEPETLPYDPQTMAPMGCLPGDFNEDGLTDILVYYWGRTPICFLRRADTAAAQPAQLKRSLYSACEISDPTQRWYTNAATAADLDGDGHLDLIICNYFPDGARILDPSAEGDEQMQDSMSRAFNGGGKHLLLWDGAKCSGPPGVRFKEVKGVFDDKVAYGWTLAVGAADLDGDLLPEIYFANDFGPDRLFHNLSTPGHLRFQLLEGLRSFGTPSSKVLGRDSFKGMGVDFADLNEDGLLDIYVSNIAAEFALQESHFVFVSTGRLSQMKEGIAPYVDRSDSLGLSRSGWAWDARFADFNNDTVLEALQATGFVKGETSRWPELHELATGNDQLLRYPASWPRFAPGDDLSGHQHNPFFVRAPDGRYYDIAADLGMGAPMVSRGIAIADVDGDGRLDFAVANQWEPSVFYHNLSPHTGMFLELRLMLPLNAQTAEPARDSSDCPARGVATRPAIGATATVYLPNGRKLTAQVDGGNGHSGKRSPELHFGLGDLSPGSTVKVELRWRDINGRVRQQVRTLSPGRHTILLKEASDGELTNEQ